MCILKMTVRDWRTDFAQKCKQIAHKVHVCLQLTSDFFPFFSMPTLFGIALKGVHYIPTECAVLDFCSLKIVAHIKGNSARLYKYC